MLWWFQLFVWAQRRRCRYVFVIFYQDWFSKGGIYSIHCQLEIYSNFKSFGTIVLKTFAFQHWNYKCSQRRGVSLLIFQSVSTNQTVSSGFVLKTEAFVWKHLLYHSLAESILFGGCTESKLHRIFKSNEAGLAGLPLLSEWAVKKTETNDDLDSKYKTVNGVRCYYLKAYSHLSR